MKTYIFILFTTLSFSSISQDTSSVLFGHHADSIKTTEANLLRIFLDKNGDFYPENIINDRELRSDGESQLIKWSEKFPEKFVLIAKDYNITLDDYSIIDFERLQDSIVKNIARKINQSSKRKSVTTLIHGFRKKPYGQISGSTFSSVDNAFGRSKMDRTNFFLEVYWDGHYRKSPANLKQLLELGEIFRSRAVPSAENAGYALRKLFNQVKCEKLNLISHSTGTHVSTSLLFNKSKGLKSPTPNHKEINIVLLASASSGKEHFKNYYSRNTNLDFKTNDNYRLFIIYNEADFVLKKKGFARLRGNTTLGCNHHNEAKKLKRYFDRKFPNSFFLIKRTTKIKNHSFQFYTSSNAFTETMNLIYVD